MTQTEILIDVRDMGRRLAGINIKIPAEIAIAEVRDAIDALTEDLVYG
jgi:glycine cleavage system regulatory protein